MYNHGEYMKTTKEVARDALEANTKLQATLSERALNLEAELKEIDRLLDTQQVESDPESEIAIPGSKRAVGLFPSTEFLNPVSPFYQEAKKRTTYCMNTHPHSMKDKDMELLADAVKKENERLQAFHCSRIIDPSANAAETSIDVMNNIEGIDWDRVAEKISDVSSVKRNATECRINWVANGHPRVNHAQWSSAELEKLYSIVSEYPSEKVNWVAVADKLGTNRIPIDCMRHGLPRQRLNLSPDADQKLMKAVETYGIDNWHLVARSVSEHATPTQCQARWQKSLDPSLKRGAWSEEEDNRLRKAVAGYGSSWIHVATAVPGRTNDQCRERWLEHLNAGLQLAWTDEEDKILMDTVAELGNKWIEISKKIGNTKTAQACRQRHKKLKRMQASETSGQSRIELAPPVPHSPPSATVQEYTGEEFSLLVANALPVSLAIPPQPRPLAKGKEKDGPPPSGVDRPSPMPTASAMSKDSSSFVERMQGVTFPIPSGTRPRPRPRPQKLAPKVIDIAENGLEVEQDKSADAVPDPSKASAPTGRKRKPVDNLPNAPATSKKTRTTRSQTKLTTTQNTVLQAEEDTTGGDSSTDPRRGEDAPSTSKTVGHVNTEAVQLRRGRSAAKGKQ